MALADYSALILVAIAIIVGVFSSNGLGWSHPEYIQYLLPRALESGLRMQLTDFTAMFDAISFDQVPRIRILSYATTILVSKIRAFFLVEYGWYHPSMSLIWIPLLTVVPWGIFRFMRTLFDRKTAWVAVTLLLSTPGFLSNLILLFHPGKPLVFIFLCASFGIVSMLFQRYHWRTFALLPLLSLGALLSDETGIMVVAIQILALAFGLFRPHRIRTTLYLILLLPVFIYLTLGWQMPRITSSLGFKPAEYFSYALSSTHRSHLVVWNYFRHMGILAGSHLEPSTWVLHATKGAEILGCLLLGVLIFFVYRVRRWGQFDVPAEPLRVRLFLISSLLVCLLLHWAVMARHDAILSETRSCYYYGTFFSIFIAVFIAVWMRNWTTTKRNFWVLILTSLFLSNLFYIDRHWKKVHFEMLNMFIQKNGWALKTELPFYGPLYLSANPCEKFAPSKLLTPKQATLAVECSLILKASK